MEMDEATRERIRESNRILMEALAAFGGRAARRERAPDDKRGADDDDDDEYRNAWAGMRSRNPARLPRGAGLAKRARTSGFLVDWTQEKVGGGGGLT